MTERKEQAYFAIYYAAVYGPVAVSLTFLPSWMRGTGASDSAIGILLALGAAQRLIANPITSHYADTKGNRNGTLKTLCVATCLCSFFYLFVSNPVELFLIYLLVNFFWSSVLPVGDSIVVLSIKRHSIDYGHARRWGSLSFLLLSLLLGQWVALAGDAVVIPAIIAAYIALLVVVWKLPASGDRDAHEARAPIRKVMAHPAFAWLLGSAAVCQATHGVFYSFGTLNWLDHNVPPSLVGILWAGGIASEIAVFSVIRTLPDFVRPSKLILIGCIAACARWGMLGARSDIFFAIVVQGLQGLSLGATQSGVAQFISRALPEGIASSATGLYATVAVGLMQTGLVLVSGMWFDTIGGGIFLFAAAFAAIGSICAFKLAKYDISERTRPVPQIAA